MKNQITGFKKEQSFQSEKPKKDGSHKKIVILIVLCVAAVFMILGASNPRDRCLECNVSMYSDGRLLYFTNAKNNNELLSYDPVSKKIKDAEEPSVSEFYTAAFYTEDYLIDVTGFDSDQFESVVDQGIVSYPFFAVRETELIRYDAANEYTVIADIDTREVELAILNIIEVDGKLFVSAYGSRHLGGNCKCIRYEDYFIMTINEEGTLAPAIKNGKAINGT